MILIQINTSANGMPGEVIAFEDGQAVWAGPIEAIAEAERFDALFCHDDDKELLIGIARASGFELAEPIQKIEPVGPSR